MFVVNGFDTFEAANALRLKGRLGLAKLCEHYELMDDADDDNDDASGGGEGGKTSYTRLKADRKGYG